MVLHFSMYNFKNMQFWAITLEKKIKRALELKIKRGVKIVQCINNDCSKTLNIKEFLFLDLFQQL